MTEFLKRLTSATTDIIRRTFHPEKTVHVAGLYCSVCGDPLFVASRKDILKIARQGKIGQEILLKLVDHVRESKHEGVESSDPDFISVTIPSHSGEWPEYHIDIHF